MIPTVALAVASFAGEGPAEHPLIDIDQTVWIQLALFLIVALIASRLLFRPYLKMRDQRTSGIEGAREDATRVSSEADARLVDYEQKIAVARSRAQDERRVMRAEAAEHQRKVVDAARAESTRSLDQAKERIHRETEAARADLMPRAAQVADDIASKLLDRRVG